LKADSAPREGLVYEKPAGVTEKTRTPVSATRGMSSKIPETLALGVLCPDHTGLTVQEGPSIFWFMNEPLKNVTYELKITKVGEKEALLEKQLDPEKDFGIQRINLKDIAKTLEPDSEYRVSVVIVPDPKRHSNDLITSGRIKRVPAPEKLVSKLLSRPTPAERAIVYARQGIWYDALAAISDQIAADPANKQLHLDRAELLKQVGLPEAADFDRKLGS
jgi:hypothetical protein